MYCFKNKIPKRFTSFCLVLRVFFFLGGGGLHSPIEGVVIYAYLKQAV